MGVVVIGILGRLVAYIVVNGSALWLASVVVDGVHFDGNLVALAFAAVIFGAVNLVIRPFVILLTLPLTIFTFGLFLIVVNALMLMLTGVLSSAYSVEGFWAALLGSIVISIVSMALNFVIGELGMRSTRGPGWPLGGGHLGKT